MSGPEDRQQFVVDSLDKVSPRLSTMYATALELISRSAPSGFEVPRVALISHCMRELMMGLPQVMSVESIPRPDPSSSSLLLDLPGVLAEFPEIDLEADLDRIPVRREVARAFQALIVARTQEEGRNRANAAALVTGGLDGSDPVISQWLNAYEFFVDWAHLDRGHARSRPLPDETEILKNVRVVEDVIEVRSRMFFENLRTLEDILSDANAVDEESVP
jgi:hypothetical protein